ncbi:roadblock/LC7 domain-containing protein [Tenacibaculum sp. IB213877]|uniref:roadblock/LC7 domain-containing protein n=1 Tax=Tenacibaculum sp. IB213877 TaxID=3097351 RepID=UPI002A5A1FDC|nr:roadblock/LC7 domain-containing protein [Tenacibaculum sp. IB213877]MDY0780803.1 roadblock/LC7 domain-containing protein [Tenacibaculum sp. IB213877]
MDKQFDLAEFLKRTNADGAIIINSGGELIEAENVDYGNNFAAMMGVMTKMAEDFTDDIKIGKLRQVVFKATEGVFVLDKFDEDFIVGIYSKDLAKAGMIMMLMDNLTKKKKA